MTFQIENDDAEVVGDFTATGAVDVDYSGWWDVQYMPRALPAGRVAPLGVMAFRLELSHDGGPMLLHADLAHPATEAWVLVEESVLSWRKIAGATFHGDEAELGIVDDSAFDGDPTSGFVSAYQGFTVPTSADFSVSNGSTTVAQIQADGAWGYSDVTWQATGAVSPAAPAGVSAPQAGDAVTVTVTLAQPVNTVWKLVGGEWTAVTGATFSGTTVTYTLVDGGPLDDDGVANGVIVDPVLFGVAAAFTG